MVGLEASKRCSSSWVHTRSMRPEPRWWCVHHRVTFSIIIMALMLLLSETVARSATAPSEALAGITKAVSQTVGLILPMNNTVQPLSLML